MPELSARARQASEELSREGMPVRFVRSVFVPEDGTCFHLYQAGSLANVLEAADRARMKVEHVRPVTITGHPPSE